MHIVSYACMVSCFNVFLSQDWLGYNLPVVPFNGIADFVDDDADAEPEDMAPPEE